MGASLHPSSAGLDPIYVCWKVKWLGLMSNQLVNKYKTSTWFTCFTLTIPCLQKSFFLFSQLWNNQNMINFFPIFIKMILKTKTVQCDVRYHFAPKWCIWLLFFFLQNHYFSIFGFWFPLDWPIFTANESLPCMIMKMILCF